MTYYIDDQKVTNETFFPSLIADIRKANASIVDVAERLWEHKAIVLNQKTYKLEETK